MRILVVINLPPGSRARLLCSTDGEIRRKVTVSRDRQKDARERDHGRMSANESVADRDFHLDHSRSKLNTRSIINLDQVSRSQLRTVSGEIPRG